MTTETNAERLLQVKENLRNIMICLGRANGKTQLLDDINWLIQQSERAQELEKEMKDIIETADVIDYRSQVMREALKFYADPHNRAFSADTATFHRINQSEVMKEFGEKARQALEGIDHGKT